MNYDTIISWVVEATFAWLFVALNGKIQLTKAEKRPFFYKFSLWLSMITSFIGFTLSVYDEKLAVVFSPYVLITCALVYTSVDFYYLTSKSKENAPGWLDIKSKVYSSLFQTMGIVALVFLGLGIKNDVLNNTNNIKMENKIDSLSTKFDNNALTAKKDRAQIKITLDSSNKVRTKQFKSLEEKVDHTINNEKTKTKQLKNIKKDTEDIKDKVDDVSTKTPLPKEKKKFLFF